MDLSLKVKAGTKDHIYFVLKDNRAPRPKTTSLVFSRRNIMWVARQWITLLSFVAVHVCTVYSVTCTGDGKLLRGKGRNLADYQLIHGSTITVCVRVKGGPGRLQPIPGVIGVTSQQPDMITLDNSPKELRAIMPCGHVISEEAFTICCCHICSSRRLQMNVVLLLLLF